MGARRHLRMRQGQGRRGDTRADRAAVAAEHRDVDVDRGLRVLRQQHQRRARLAYLAGGQSRVPGAPGTGGERIPALCCAAKDQYNVVINLILLRLAPDCLNRRDLIPSLSMP